MSEPRKPIFGFLWPKPDPHAPVDGAYRQVRKVRITPRGPVRVVVLALGTALMTVALGTVVMAAVATPLSFATLIAGAVCATALAIVLRGWVVGTFVTDAAVTVETTWRQVTVPWSAVTAVTTGPMRSPWLGLPLGVRADRTVLHLTDGTTLATHVYATSPDLWLRPEAFDMARLRLEHWRDHA